LPSRGFAFSSIPAARGIPEDQWASLEPTSNQTLDVLKTRDSEREEYRKAILNAELIDFGPSETKELTPLLRLFIQKYRNSNVPADLLAVGSAIRTFVAVAPRDEAFDFAAELLKAGSRLPLPIEIEIEISKMVVRKLTANPPHRQDQYPELASRLSELAKTYLNPRLLPREKHGAVALNAVLGIVLTRDPRASEIIEHVRAVGVAWFQQVVARQAAILAADVHRRRGSEEYPELIRSLEELVAAASPVSSQ